MFKLLCLNMLLFSKVLSYRCDRRPYGSSAPPSEPDGRFKLLVLGAESNSYISEQLYMVQIKETDGESVFTGFMISAEGDIKVDPRNPRRSITLDPGRLRPQNPELSKFSDKCLYSVEQTTNSDKSSVEVYWQAPPSGNGCVTLRAMVAESDEIWFEDGGPLTKKLCEDMRQPDDVAPQLNEACGICDEAKYELTFTGIWSRNTHPRLYPENDWIPRFSDLVGASHDPEYILWLPGKLATEGFREMAEHANSSALEAEIREKIGDGTRTLIKGKGHGYRRMSNPTYAFFRVDKTNHLFSAAVALHPSPDWFLGVTRFELCQEDNTWLPERELNLYPWDAGTDSGVSYESPNLETYPRDTITRVEMSTYDKNSPFYEMDMKEMHPFGKLHIKLIRTYHKDCEQEETTEPPEEISTTTEAEENGSSEEGDGEGSEEGEGNEEGEASEEPQPSEPEPARYQTQLDSGSDGGEPPAVTESSPEPQELCPMSPWLDWSTCEGPCENGKAVGYKWRVRYHLVDGVPVEKYNPHAKRGPKKPVSRYCKLKYNVFEEAECEENCNDEEIDGQGPSVERRVMTQIQPGGKWKTKRGETRTN